jgi:predicted dithiol-disulfide oxidoreductase (DUF899 family)
MTERKVGTREEWLAARKELLERERELDRLSDELTTQRRELPWVPVEKEYTFQTEDGPKTLAELFDGRSELMIYHVMFGPSWTAACPGCTGLADQLDGPIVHMSPRDVTMICMSHAPIEKLAAYRRRMGWNLPYVSTYGSDFGADFGVSFSDERKRQGVEYNFEPVDFDKVLEGFSGDESIAAAARSCGIDVEEYVTTEGPGLFAFALSDGVVYHTYSAYAPESNFMLFSSQILGRAPKGGDDAVPALRRDEYEQGSAA